MMDNRFDNDGIDMSMDTSGEEGAVLGALTVHATGLLFAIAGLIAGLYFTWMNAPAVGGEMWPYIRVVAMVFGGFIAMKISGIIGYVVGIPVGIAVGAAYSSLKR